MNMNFQPSGDAGALAERLFNELTNYMDVVDAAEFVAGNPSIQEIADKIAELREKSSEAKINPFGLPTAKRRWVTDRLVETKKGKYKEYKEA